MPIIKVSIIIVSYIKLDIVENCLESINAFNDINEELEVILVDNSPETERLDLYLKSKFPWLITIKNKNNGFGHANNVGAELASGKYLFFLNPDTLLVEPVLAYAFNKMEKNRFIGMLGFQLVSEKNKKNMSFYFLNAGGIIRSILIKTLNFWGLYIDGLMYLSGANMFIPKDVFLKIGKFDENIFMYYEEPDLTYRLQNLRMKTLFIRHKRIIHLEGGTSQDHGIALERRLDSAEYYNKKYNKDFSIQLRRELRVLYMKKFIYRLISPQKNLYLKKQIDALNYRLSNIHADLST